MGFIGFNLNLMDQLVFYGRYHQKLGNQIVHFFFVPAIMWSAGVWLAYLGPVSATVDVPSHLDFLPTALAEAYVFNYAAVGLLLFMIYYTSLEPFAGLSWGVVLGVPLIGLCNAFQQHVPCAWGWALFVHVLGWFMQVQVGHIMIEGRKPALMDSFFQGLVLAGLFAWMEGLFVLGYRPKLQAELHRRINASFSGEATQTQPLMGEGGPKAAIAS